MNPKNNKEDIEELNFDDVELEIKLDNNDLKLDLELDNDNSGTKTSSDSNLNEPSDSTGSESNESHTNETPSQDASGSEDLPASSEGNNSSDNTPSENDDLSSSPDNNLNDENDLSEAKDESLPDKDDQEAKEDSSKEENKDSEDKNNKGDNEDKKNFDNKDTNADGKKESDNENDTETNKKDSQNNSNEKDDKNPKDDNKPKDKENNSAPNKNNNEPKNGLDKKRDDLKNQRDNKPKPGKDSKPGLKDKGKNFGKNLGNNLKNGAKNKAKDALNNSKAGQAVNKAADAVDKAKKTAKVAKAVSSGVGKAVSFFSTPLGQGIAIVLAVIVGIILWALIIYSVLSIFFPNLGGPVEDEENYSKYSTVDQKTITNLRKLSDKYAGDPSYAMVATIYPYIEELQGGNVNALKGKTNDDLEDDISEDDEDVTAEGIEEDAKDDENDLSQDDPYLELLRERHYLNKFKKLLKKSMDGEDSLTSYLKNTYFKSDKGYKELFNGTSNEEELKDAIIEDLLSLKDDFNGYFFENRNCTVNLTSVGTVEIDELLKSNILVDVKVDSCTDAASDCSSWHSNPISLKDYILGVVWTEISISTSTDFEQVKAQMIAAKAYALGKHKNLVKETDDGSYVITMLSNIKEQDYCDYMVGCPPDKMSKNRHPAASSEVITLLEQAWEETKNVYVYDEAKKSPVGAYCADRIKTSDYDCSWCTNGSCMSQTELSAYSETSYSQILGDQYSKYSIITVEGDYAEASVVSGTTCSAKGYGIPDNQFKFYYQTDYFDKPFCDATDANFVSGCPKDGGKNNICTSGCGATSYAMLISNLSDTEFDPVAANAESASIGGCATGSGTYDKLFTNITSHEGFSIEPLSNDEKGVNDAIAALKNGALIAANVQAKSPFTTGGHWILLRGLTEDNMVKVADPNSKERSLTGTYSINKFIDENWLIDENGTTHSWYAIYGPKSEEIKATSSLGVTGDVTGTFIRPIENNTACNSYPNYSSGKFHGGADIPTLTGTPVMAADGGEVVTVKDLGSRGYGRHIIIDHGNGIKTWYAHLDSFDVKEGDKVAQGQVIGKSGNTGNSTGPHLHFEIRKKPYIQSFTTLNPCTYIGTNKSYVND